MYIRKCIMTNEQFLKWRASNDSEPDDRVYLDRWFDEKTPEDINFFTETDVKNWMKQHDHGGDAEYPERVKQYAKRIMWAFDFEENKDNIYIMKYDGLVFMCFCSKD